MRKIKLLILLAVSLFLLSVPSSTQASGPDLQPWMVSAVHCTGLGNVDAVRVAFGRYQDNYAALHQLNTPEKWTQTYESVVNEFVRAHGCATGGIIDGQLTFDFKVYLAVYQRDFDILPSAFGALLGK